MPRTFTMCWQLPLCGLTTAADNEMSDQNLYFRLCGMGVEIGDWGGGGAATVKLPLQHSGAWPVQDCDLNRRETLPIMDIL